MPKRQTNSKAADQNEGQAAATVPPVEPLAPTHDKNPAAVALGRLGGKKGGLARAAKLTKAQRSAIAKKAARARWGKKGG
jgi:hypothetical protein